MRFAKAYADPMTGLSEDQAREMAVKLGLDSNELSLQWYQDVPRFVQRIHEVRCRYAGDQSIDR